MTTTIESSVEGLVIDAPSLSLRHRALRYLPASALVIDTAALALTAFLAIAGRNALAFFPDNGDVSHTLGVVGPLMFVLWLAAVAAAGGYSHSVFGAGPDEYKRVLNASLATAALIGIGCYLAKFQLSRGFFLLAVAFGIPLLLLGRHVLRRALHKAHRLGLLQHRVVIAGRPSHVDEVASVLSRETWLGYEVVGAVTPAGHVSNATPSGIAVLGDSESLPRIASLHDVDVVFFASGAFRTSAEMRSAAWELEQHRSQVVVAPSVTDVSRERVTVRPVGGLPLMHLEQSRAVTANRWAKRTFDIIASVLLIIILSPVLLAAAAVVKLHDRGPIVFQHTRVGRDGREFGCFKFRTMVPNAETLVRSLQMQQGAEALLFKMKDDPRITRPGKFLRRYSVDELPQLFNVLFGSMSLVGPRPQVRAEVDLYDDAMSRRLRVRPGITGLWQVSGRSDLSVEEAVRLDIYYVDNWSMMQDLSILARTVGAVVGSRGAY